MLDVVLWASESGEKQANKHVTNKMKQVFLNYTTQQTPKSLEKPHDIRSLNGPTHP